MRRKWDLLLVSGLALAAASVLPGTARAQVLSLEDALHRAAEQGYASRGAAAEVRAQAGQAGQSLRAFLPTIKFDAGYVRTTDPLGAFGAILRRREVTPAAFDPASLNFPDDIGQLSTAVVLEQPLFNLDAWYARRAATRGTRVAAAMHRWVQLESQVEVVRAYYGAILAAEQVRTLETAAEAAQAHLRQAESLLRNGMVTQSDVLLASVRAGEVESQLVAARGSVPISRMRIALVLGTPGDTGFTLPQALPPSHLVDRIGRSATPPPSFERADVEAANLALEAAGEDKRRATAQLVPRINTFGRLDWNSPDTPFGGREAWTVGIMLSWSPFTGGSELAQRSAAEGRRLGAQAQAEAVEAKGELERAQAATSLEVALAQMTILDTAVTQSVEAHRIVSRKYAGGLSTVIELFDAAARETAARLGASRARYDAIMALAERWRASGSELSALTRLEEGD
jgi:outer membrane protein TolC